MLFLTKKLQHDYFSEAKQNLAYQVYHVYQGRQ